MAFFGRGKNKIQDVYTIKDFYKFYCNNTKENPIYKVSYSVYKETVCEFYKSMVNNILEKSFVFKLPFRLGKLFVMKEKVNLNKLFLHSVNWEKTVEYGKVIYHLNEHTDGYRYTYQWDKRNTAIVNLYFYRFIPTRSNKRRLAKLIKSGDYDYFEK